jgi:acetyl esterase/lipase
VTRSAFVVVGSKVRLDRPGLSIPAPGTVEVLLRHCHRWAAEVGWTLTSDLGAADALVVGPGIAPPPVDVPVATVRPGQGLDGFRWALRHVAFTAEWPPEVVAYGPAPDHRAHLRRPSGSGGDRVAVLVHGGFWHDAWGLDLMDGLAVDLARRGWVTWNVEYRRIGGGAWPVTGRDVVAALDALDDVDGVASDDLLLVGHSAGAQLALWAAGERPELVARVVSLAGLCDLEVAERQGLGGGAVRQLLVEEPASVASPIDRLPLGRPVLLAHATDDPLVPVAQSRHYLAAAQAVGDEAHMVEVAGVDHFSLIDPAADWPVVAALL